MMDVNKHPVIVIPVTHDITTDSHVNQLEKLLATWPLA